MKENSKTGFLGNTSSLLFVILSIVMVVSIGFVGILLTSYSVTHLKDEIWNNMESVATTAATLVDGDELKLITKADMPVLDPETESRIGDGSERFMKIERTLLDVKRSQKKMFIPLFISLTSLKI